MTGDSDSPVKVPRDHVDSSVNKSKQNADKELKDRAFIILFLIEKNQQQQQKG